jgi:anti-anti-sigma factor
MSIEIQNKEDSVTIVIDAHLISGEPYFKEFESISSKICEFESKAITIDLFKCSYMDTRAISVILEIHRLLRKTGRVLTLVNVNEDIGDLLRSIKLDKIIQLC